MLDVMLAGEIGELCLTPTSEGLQSGSAQVSHFSKRKTIVANVSVVSETNEIASPCSPASGGNAEVVGKISKYNSPVPCIFCYCTFQVLDCTPEGLDLLALVPHVPCKMTSHFYLFMVKMQLVEIPLMTIFLHVLRSLGITETLFINVEFRGAYQVHIEFEADLPCALLVGAKNATIAVDDMLRLSAWHVATKLDSIYTTSGGKKLNLITHSIEGLLVKYFIYLHRDVFEKYFKSSIAIVVPFQGVPGYIATSLLNEMSFVEGWESKLFISKGCMKQSVWRENLDNNGKKSALLKSHEPVEAIKMIEKALSKNEIIADGMHILVGQRKLMIYILSSTKLPESVNFYNIYGTDYDTPHIIWFRVPEALSHVFTFRKNMYVDCEGSVPVESAKVDGLNAGKTWGCC